MHGIRRKNKHRTVAVGAGGSPMIVIESPQNSSVVARGTTYSPSRRMITTRQLSALKAGEAPIWRRAYGASLLRRVSSRARLSARPQTARPGVGLPEGARDLVVVIDDLHQAHVALAALADQDLMREHPLHQLVFGSREVPLVSGSTSSFFTLPSKASRSCAGSEGSGAGRGTTGARSLAWAASTP